jgi:hypothetical protein
MKRTVLLGIILSGTSLSTFAQSTDIQKPITISPNVSIQNMDWAGRSTVGALGVQAEIKLPKKINLSIGSGAFKSLGTVDNNSDLPNAVSANGDKFGNPATTAPTGLGQSGLSGLPKTAFQGGFLNIDAGIPIKLGDSSRTSIEPFIGIEGKMWSRTMEYGTEVNPITTEEKFKFLSPSLGAKLNYSTKSKVRLSLRISASYPVISKMKTDAKSLAIPNSEIDLTKYLSPSIELGARIKKITIKLRYERINMGNTDTLRGCSSPSLNTTGLSIGYDF